MDRQARTGETVIVIRRDMAGQDPNTVVGGWGERGVRTTEKNTRAPLFYNVLLYQMVTKRCRLSWLTNSALVYEPKCRGRGELRGLSQ